MMTGYVFSIKTLDDLKFFSSFFSTKKIHGSVKKAVHSLLCPPLQAVIYTLH